MGERGGTGLSEYLRIALDRSLGRLRVNVIVLPKLK
jgi:hypothetical protein